MSRSLGTEWSTGPAGFYIILMPENKCEYESGHSESNGDAICNMGKSGAATPPGGHHADMRRIAVGFCKRLNNIADPLRRW
jgi:hypothetical protein